jgi:hypothetical protein
MRWLVHSGVLLRKPTVVLHETFFIWRTLVANVNVILLWFGVGEQHPQVQPIAQPGQLERRLDGSRRRTLARAVVSHAALEDAVFLHGGAALLHTHTPILENCNGVCPTHARTRLFSLFAAGCVAEKEPERVFITGCLCWADIVCNLSSDMLFYSISVNACKHFCEHPIS